MSSVRIDLAVTNGKLTYSVSRGGKPILSPSPIGLFTSQGPLGGSDLEVTGVEQSSVKDIYRPIVGKAAQVPDRYEQSVMHLRRKADGVAFDVIARAYDDGVAYRLVLPPQERFKTLDIYWETTGFYFPANYDC